MEKEHETEADIARRISETGLDIIKVVKAMIDEEGLDYSNIVELAEYLEKEIKEMNLADNAPSDDRHPEGDSEE